MGNRPFQARVWLPNEKENENTSNYGIFGEQMYSHLDHGELQNYIFNIGYMERSCAFLFIPTLLWLHTGMIFKQL